MDRDVERDAKVLARRQAGVLSISQARAVGISRQSQARRVAWGHYERWPGGVLHDVAVAVSDRTHWFAATLAVGQGSALAIHTACRVYELGSAVDDGLVHVLVNCTCRHHVAGVVAHRSLTLAPRHLTTREGLLVTTPERTLCDVAGRVGPVRLRRLVAEAVRRRLTDAASLRAVMEEAGRFRGKVALREIVDELSPLARVTASALESEFLHLVTSAGLAPTAVNHPVVDAEGVTRYIDAVYLPERQPVELDSHLSHGSLLDWHDDTRRENRIVLKGWRSFLRFNWSDVTRDGHLVVESIRRALGRPA